MYLSQTSKAYTSEKVIYTGLFLSETAKEKLLQQVPPKFKQVIAHHLTLKFRPDDGIQSIDLGKVRILRLVGQVVDEEIGIQAVLVEQSSDVKTASKNPHITISCRAGVAPVKSNEAIEKALANGSVVPFEEPIEIEVVEGFFDGTNDVKAIPNKG